MSENHKVEAVVEEFARKEFEVEHNLKQIVWIISEANPPDIRLLEINPDTIATGMVQSFYFPPSAEIPYAMKIAEVTPEEWRKVQHNEIRLPKGWSLENHKIFVREAVHA